MRPYTLFAHMRHLWTAALGLHQRRVTELRTLGVSADEIERLTAFVRRLTERTSFPKEIIVDECWLYAKMRVQQQQSLLPVNDTNEWAAGLVDWLLGTGALRYGDLVTLHIVKDAVREAAREVLGMEYWGWNTGRGLQSPDPPTSRLLPFHRGTAVLCGGRGGAGAGGTVRDAK